MDHIDGVGAGPFCHRQGHRRFFILPRFAVEHVVVRFLRTVDDLRDISEINRMAVINAHDNLADLGRGAEELSGLQQHLLVKRLELSGVLLRIRLLESRNQLLWRQVPSRQQQRVKLNPHLPPGAADKFRLSDVRNRLDFVINLGRQSPQHKMVITSSMEGQGQNRHIIDGVRLDQGLGDPGRNPVKIGGQLLIEANNGRFRILADIKPDYQQALTGHRG